MFLTVLQKRHWGCPPGRVALIWEMLFTLVSPFAQITCGPPSTTLFFVPFQLNFWARPFFRWRRMLILRAFMCIVAEWVDEWMTRLCFFGLLLLYIRNNSATNSNNFAEKSDGFYREIRWIWKLTFTFSFPFTSSESSLSGG